MQKSRPGASARSRILGAVCAFTLTAVGCGPATEPAAPLAPPESVNEGQAPVVYGQDDRMDVYAHPDATLRARAQQATVALMTAETVITTNPNDVAFDAGTLVDFGVCSTERFANDISPAFCSGVLIDDDLVLTAGHCITTAAECADTRFVFKFYKTSETGLETITTQDVFSCKSIVVRREDAEPVNGQILDYGIIRLDRPATPRFTPAPVRPGNTALTVGDKLGVIGSGDGLAFKIDSGGAVLEGNASTLDYFVANLDTFGGNSGSAVYELSSYTVAGILVYGQTDYVNSDPEDPDSCYVVNVCDETGCEGAAEESTYVRPAIDHFCRANTSTRLCGARPPPPVGPGSYTFSASNTASATVNTVNKKLTLAAGQSLTVGTCGMTGASFTGDTFLRVAGPGGVEVASNDDGCGGRGSKLTFTAAVAGEYELRAGCYGATSCNGTVAWTATSGTATSGTLDFSATNTNSAQQNTVNQELTVTAGQTLHVGTCGVAGASATGDTYLRLFNAAGTQVALNDDGCGGSTSKIAYTVPAGAGGKYTVRVGCYGNTSCGGKLAWSIQ